MLIADDTMYRRDRSKRVELLARVHDHNTGLYVRGFRMLTLGWSDGNSFVPMMLSMLSSAMDDNRLAPMRDGIDKRTNGYQRRRESMRKSTDLLVDMVALAMTAGTTARHLLFDSWFAFPATIRRIHALGMHTICMLKDTKNITYELQGWPLTLKELYKEVRKRPGRAKILAEVLVTVGQDNHGNPVKREHADPRTLGSLFHAVCDELRQIDFTEALALLLRLLEQTLGSIIGLCKEQVQLLIQRFIETLPELSGSECCFWPLNAANIYIYQAVTANLQLRKLSC